MGEYFNGVKLGTCEHLMYVNRKELMDRLINNPNEVNTEHGSASSLREYLKLEYNYIYRFPFEDELNQSWEQIGMREHDKTFVVSIDPEKVGIPHEDFIQTHINDKCFNLPFCPYSDKAKELGIVRINQWYIDIEIVGERYNKKNPDGYTLFKCPMCGEWFALDEAEAEHVKTQLIKYGKEYEASHIKPKIA